MAPTLSVTFAEYVSIPLSKYIISFCSFLRGTFVQPISTTDVNYYLVTLLTRIKVYVVYLQYFISVFVFNTFTQRGVMSCTDGLRFFINIIYL